MDRHPQQIKRERQDKKRRSQNIDNLSKMRTYIKTFLSSTSRSDAEKIYSNTVKIIDKAINKNLIHKNNGARKKSLITRHLNSLS